MGASAGEAPFVGKETLLGGRHQGILQSLFAVPGAGFHQLALVENEVKPSWKAVFEKLLVDTHFLTAGLGAEAKTPRDEPGALPMPQSCVAFGAGAPGAHRARAILATRGAARMPGGVCRGQGHAGAAVWNSGAVQEVFALLRSCI